MQLNVKLSGSDTVYIKTENSVSEGGFTFVMYRENGVDSVGYDGQEHYREMCCKIADVIFEEVNEK